jgi:tRNA A37 threonylcarbamoyladenosine synthetase subunit TsaC/SUA5/YrdC
VELSAEPTIGVRVPDHDFARKLLVRVGPMAVSSANRSSAATTRTAREVLAQLSDQIELVVDGGISPGGKASSVIAFEQGQLVVLREGPVDEATLARAL